MPAYLSHQPASPVRKLGFFPHFFRSCAASGWSRPKAGRCPKLGRGAWKSEGWERMAWMLVALVLRAGGSRSYDPWHRSTDRHLSTTPPSSSCPRPSFLTPPSLPLLLLPVSCTRSCLLPSPAAGVLHSLDDPAIFPCLRRIRPIDRSGRWITTLRLDATKPDRLAQQWSVGLLDLVAATAHCMGSVPASLVFVHCSSFSLSLPCLLALSPAPLPITPHTALRVRALRVPLPLQLADCPQRPQARSSIAPI